MTKKERQAHEHRQSALNLRTRAKDIEDENPERAAAWLKEAEDLEAAAAKLSPAPKPPAKPAAP